MIKGMAEKHVRDIEVSGAAHFQHAHWRPRARALTGDWRHTAALAHARSPSSALPHFTRILHAKRRYPCLPREHDLIGSPSERACRRPNSNSPLMAQEAALALPITVISLLKAISRLLKDLCRPHRRPVFEASLPTAR